MTQQISRKVIFAGETQETELNSVIKPIQQNLLNQQREEYYQAQKTSSPQRNSTER